jgi:hypothetical protein
VIVVLLSGLAGLAALNRGDNGGKSEGGSAENVIRDDVHFYGQSSPVFPARK